MLTMRAAAALVAFLVPCTAFGTADEVALAGDPPQVTGARLHAAAALAAGPVETAGLRAVTRIVASPAVASPRAANVVTATTPRRGWIARHPILFGALAGAAAGTVVAAAAWGGEGAFVGLYGGAAAGAVVGAVLR